MSTDADRWNERYANAAPPPTITAHPLLLEAISVAAPGGRAADVACGWGDAGLHLATAGFDVTCLDVSTVALAAVRRRAESHDIGVTTSVHDTVAAGPPVGPWSLVWCAHYLDREFLRRIARELGAGGVAAIAIATETNLERHERPSARFLLAPEELASLVVDESTAIEVLRSDEGWRENGVHEAWLIVRKRNDIRAQAQQ